MNNKRTHPIIGFCVSEDHYPGLLNLVTNRLQLAHNQFPFIRFLFKDIDFEKLQVKGEKFKKNTETWEEGIFPFPSVIYMQCAENQESIRKLEKVIGPYVFNNFIFDKWEGHNLLTKSNHIRKHLPNTQLLQKKFDFIDFVKGHNYKDIILKPLFRYCSEGIYRIKFQENKNIEVLYSDGIKMVSQEFNNLKHFFNFLPQEIFSGTYIIQQYIDTVTERGNVSDIRLNMSKNNEGHWQMSLLLFRIATNNSIVLPRSVVCYNKDNIMNSSLYGKEKMSYIGKSILNLGLKICLAFDQSGHHMADLGIDLGMDKDSNLWIFEVNPLPFPYSGTVQDYSLTKPVDYALYLASKKIKNS